MDLHEDIAVVKEIKDNFVFIEIIKTGACDNCALRGICHANERKNIHKIRNKLKLNVGDMVRVHISPGVRIFSSFLIFIFPIICMIIFYIISKFVIRLTENFSILLSFIGLLLSGIIIHSVDKKYANSINFEIVERVKQ